MEENKNKPHILKDLRRLAEKILRKEPERRPKMPSEDMEEIIHELRVHQIELEMQNEQLRKTYSELEASRNRYHDLYDFAPIGYLTLTEKGLIREVNLAGAELLGVERRFLITSGFSQFIAREDRDRFYFQRQKVLETRQKQTCELKLLKKDGSVIFTQLQCIALEDERGNFNGLRVAISDITQRKQAEVDLSKYHEHLEELVKERTKELMIVNEQLQKAQQIAHLGSWEWDISTGEGVWSDEQFRIFGYTPGQIQPTYDHFVKAIHPDDSDRVLQAVQKAMEGTHRYVLEFRIIRPDKTMRRILAQGVVSSDKNDKPIKMIGTVLDITERKMLEV